MWDLVSEQAYEGAYARCYALAERFIVDTYDSLILATETGIEHTTIRFPIESHITEVLQIPESLENAYLRHPTKCRVEGHLLLWRPHSNAACVHATGRQAQAIHVESVKRRRSWTKSRPPCEVDHGLVFKSVSCRWYQLLHPVISA